MRATCEFAEKKGLAELPSIKCKIYKTEEDLTIKISDLGGGIKVKYCWTKPNTSEKAPVKILK